jgi:DegV family protein with EDD domain
MPGIRIVTDSAADLPDAIVRSLGVTVVPLDVRLGTADAEEIRALDPAEFWRRCAETDALPETSAPSPGDFRAAFLDAAAQGYDGVVCVTISSELSATYQAAVAGARELPKDLAVAVVDSRSATMGEGLLVLDAAERVAEGGALDAIVEELHSARERIKVFGTLDTLENLRRGGRIGSAQAFLGSLLSIKPVIEVRGGRVESESRQRTRARSLQYLADKVASAGPLKRVAVVHAAAADVDTLVDLVSRSFPREEVVVAYIGPVIGAHAGPGSIGVCYETAEGSSG